MKAAPQRLRLSRQKGYSLEAASRVLNGLEAVKITRPGPWGNPFRFAPVKTAAGKTIYMVSGDPQRRRFEKKTEAHDLAIALFAHWLKAPAQAEFRKGVGRALAGKNVACWCRLDESCHGDVYLGLLRAGKGR
jgi:hypothetical protein